MYIFIALLVIKTTLSATVTSSIVDSFLTFLDVNVITLTFFFSLFLYSFYFFCMLGVTRYAVHLVQLLSTIYNVTFETETPRGEKKNRCRPLLPY